jgi:hypothetical protein
MRYKDIKRELYLLDTYLLNPQNIKKGLERARKVIMELIEF